MVFITPNWFQHVNDNGYRFMGFQPKCSTIHANEHAVILAFGDDHSGAGRTFFLTHRSFKDFILSLATVHVSIEAKQ